MKIMEATKQGQLARDIAAKLFTISIHPVLKTNRGHLLWFTSGNTMASRLKVWRRRI